MDVLVAVVEKDSRTDALLAMSVKRVKPVQLEANQAFTAVRQGPTRLGGTQQHRNGKQPRNEIEEVRPDPRSCSRFSRGMCK